MLIQKAKYCEKTTLKNKLEMISFWAYGIGKKGCQSLPRNYKNSLVEYMCNAPITSWKLKKAGIKKAQLLWNLLL